VNNPMDKHRRSHPIPSTSRLSLWSRLVHKGLGARWATIRRNRLSIHSHLDINRRERG
jgi:hypothetical protein